jgi:hypothetical protein
MPPFVHLSWREAWRAADAESFGAARRVR